jgi:hypothetical protein
MELLKLLILDLLGLLIVDECAVLSFLGSPLYMAPQVLAK